MQLPANAMTNELADDRKTVRLDMRLDRVADVAERRARPFRVDDMLPSPNRANDADVAGEEDEEPARFGAGRPEALARGEAAGDCARCPVRLGLAGERP